jgi:hypothetical protein
LLGALSNPTASACATWVSSVEARGSTVKVRSAQAWVSTLDDSALPPSRLAYLALNAVGAAAGLAWMYLMVSTRPCRKRCTVAGCACRNAVRTTTLVVAHWPFGHRFASLTRR